MNPTLTPVSPAPFAPPPLDTKTDLSPEEAMDTIPWDKFQYNPKYAQQPAYILISSGSFSPVTLLHTQLLTTVRDYLMVKNDYGQVLAAFLSPVHDAYGKASLIPQEHRVEMCRLATEDFSWMGVTTLETAQCGWTETRLVFDLFQKCVDLKFARNADDLPLSGGGFDVKLVFCMGSDVFLGWKNATWWSFEDIEMYLTKYRVAVLLREEDEEDVRFLLRTHPVVSRFPDGVFILPPVFKNSISSTLIRNQLNVGASVHGLVHPKVDKYLTQHGFYIKDYTLDAVAKREKCAEKYYKPLFSTKE